MAFGISKPRHSPIGIDFGADTLKLLQIIPGEPAELIAMGSAAMPEAARGDAAVRMAFLGEALPAVLAKHRFRGRRVMLSIPAFETMVHHLEVPMAQPGDLNALVNMALRERLDMEPGRMVIRNVPTSVLNRGGSQRQEVITFAAGRDVVMRYVELANRLKLEVAGMHSEPPCLLRALAHRRECIDDETAVAYLDLGAVTTKLVIGHGSKMALARTIHAGGDQWNKQLAAGQQMDFAEARLARRAEASGGVATLSPTDLSPAEQANDPCQVMACLVDELRLALRHHANRFPGRPLGKLVLVGGEASHKPTCQALARAVNTAAQLGDPLARLVRINAEASAIGIDLSQPQPGWAVPLGLCLGEANLKG